MTKRPKNNLASTRSRKLLLRLNNWVASCHHLIQKRSAGKQKAPVDPSDQEAPGVTSITEVVSDAFRAWFTPQTHLKASPDRIDYLDRVLEELVAAMDDLDSLQTDGLADRFHNVLLQVNFNARPYCLSYIGLISDRVKIKETPEQKLEMLDEYWKTVSQVQPERGLRYYDLYPGVKEFVGGWIMEEIAYLERKAARYHESPQHSIEYSQGGVPMKLLLDTSVAHLACMTRALVERGIIQNSNISDLSLLLSKSVITRRSENVSARAFRLRYYDIEDSTRLSVAKTLKNLARHVEAMGT